jgi:hypothetical protein
MYILQLLTFENEIAKLHGEKQNFYQAVVISKEKIIQEKEEEIKILQEKLHSRYAKVEKVDQMEVFESQFKKIDEFISSGARRFNSPNKKTRAYHSLLDEMNKYKLALFEIMENFKTNKQQELNLYLEKIVTEFPDIAG